MGSSRWVERIPRLKRKEAQLDQIIDTAFAVRSHHCSLVQAADLVAFVVRRHVELEAKANDSASDDELEVIKDCLKQIAPRSYRCSGAMKAQTQASRRVVPRNRTDWVREAAEG